MFVGNGDLVGPRHPKISRTCEWRAFVLWSSGFLRKEFAASRCHCYLRRRCYYQRNSKDCAMRDYDRSCQTTMYILFATISRSPGRRDSYNTSALSGAICHPGGITSGLPRDSGAIPRGETKTVTKEISLVWDDPVGSRLWETAPCDSPRHMLELSTAFLLS
jgi:hypothetical protein